EELLLLSSDVPEPLCDYKFYAFGGEVPLVLLARGRHGHRRYAWFDSGWSPVVTGKYVGLEGHMGLPENRDEMIDTARKISALLPCAFCRIDLYATSRGVVI